MICAGCGYRRNTALTGEQDAIAHRYAHLTANPDLGDRDPRTVRTLGDLIDLAKHVDAL